MYFFNFFKKGNKCSVIFFLGVCKGIFLGGVLRSGIYEKKGMCIKNFMDTAKFSP